MFSYHNNEDQRSIISHFNEFTWFEELMVHQHQQQYFHHHHPTAPMIMPTSNPSSPQPPTSSGAPPAEKSKPSPLIDHRSVREALMSPTSAPSMVKREFSPSVGFDVRSDGLSALSVVGTMMMKHDASSGGPPGFPDFDYMNMIQQQPLHLAAIGRHSSHGSERHLSTESAMNQAAAPIPTTKRSRSTHDGLMKCQFCPKKVDSEAALDRHMAECRMIRPHECDACHKRFKARGGLQQHMRIHSKEKAYICQFCTKSFTQKSHLDQHERIHTGIKPFLCTFCGRAFRQRSQQIGHEATHINHFNSSSAQQTPSQGGQTTPSSSSSTSSGGSEKREGNARNGQMLLHPSPPTPSPEQQNHLNMAAAMMQQMHHHASQNDLSSLLALNHEFVHQNMHQSQGGHHQFGQSAAEATANGMRMLSHIAS
ncbi:hypothetical protein L5515_002845 [Caenorhabditis briggsae]|uniref:C2H2-type domain-containing protein n=2 Tax=Caenorhabditis briggsae TaxID=6238 RepID=A0AAE9E971_CAEBR|nr:hypothetical protein L5515_002845 [Caenorhabditis briggsae]